MADIETAADAFTRLPIAGVRRVVQARQCTVVDASEFVCSIRAIQGTEIISVVGEDSRWRAAAVFAACRHAHGLDLADWRRGDAARLDRFWHNLNEELIAQLLAADGIAPYSRGGRTVPLDALLRTASSDNPKLAYGDRAKVRDAVRAVCDAGLAALRLGERGGYANATLSWKEHARVHTNASLSSEESDALTSIATAGL